MMRPCLSWLLTALVLLSQVGLPLHAHYCQGTLESISVLFSAGCNEHEEKQDTRSCCQPAATGCCHTLPADCCDDETMVLLQDLDSTAPHLEKWEITLGSADLTISYFASAEIVSSSTDYQSNSNDSGPPIYIRYHTLIYYA